MTSIPGTIFNQSDVMHFFRGAGRNLVVEQSKSQVEVDPIRFGELGIGTFLILLFGIMYIMVCCVGLLIRKPATLYLISTLIYGGLITFLLNAKRQSKWISDEQFVTDVDKMWFVRLIVGFILAAGCCVGLFALVTSHITYVVKAQEVESLSGRGFRYQKRYIF
mmetsp:Transcript_27713/g.40819  ORF Transcript_27713/g.40819 Transcript_27713/m.40819 type:complete len:164 (+) Transcript_27713:136-627(+)